MLDGNVAVYNLQTNLNEPIYKSHGVHGKHSKVVWEVKWGPDMQDGEINFYSVSADGTVYNWILMQNRLSLTTIITLYLDQEFTNGPDGNIIKLKGILFSILLDFSDEFDRYLSWINSCGNMHGFPSKTVKYIFNWN